MYLDITDLHMRYRNNATAAVRGVTLGLRAGDIGVLIGPSGCGKTSLLRAIAGLERIHAGSIDLQKQRVSDATTSMPPEHRRIGMVFQDYALFPHLNIARNIAFGIHHQPPQQQHQRVQQVLALVGLEGSERRFPHELSGGQQQRVALARALAPQPQLLLLDEPFSNLDIDLRERLAQEVRSILKAAGATALMVTHDQMEAFAIGDAIGVMHEGTLHQWAAPYTVYHRPATRFVANFIGHGVFAPATLQWRTAEGTSQPEQVAITALGALTESRTGLPITTQQTYPDDLCDVLLRADDIIHDDDAPVKAKIIRKSFRGSEFLYTLEMGNEQRIQAHVPSHHDHALGEWIGIRAQVDHVVTFARESGAPSGAESTQ